MTKWRLWLDSARQVGLETTLMDFLIVVRGVITGGEEVRAEFFALIGLWSCSLVLYKQTCLGVS